MAEVAALCTEQRTNAGHKGKRIVQSRKFARRKVVTWRDVPVGRSDEPLLMVAVLCSARLLLFNLSSARYAPFFHHVCRRGYFLYCSWYRNKCKCGFQTLQCQGAAALKNMIVQSHVFVAPPDSLARPLISAGRCFRDRLHPLEPARPDCGQTRAKAFRDESCLWREKH